ncbi:MAG TPA: P1 family peptidase [Micropepsaceae bacterium]|nr:P1 family peptidase [Micropepsaceae bacterium]
MTTTQPGPKNLITDVPGLRVGNAHDARAMTGATVILCDSRMVASVDMRGGAPGTRETDALTPETLVDAVDAIVLSGGSVYGLEAASGVAKWLGARGRGFKLGASNMVAPIVPAAILFDLMNGGDKNWGEHPPYDALGRAACEAASENFALGNAGAGYGAQAGQLKGGLGSASTQTDDGFIVGALAAVNPFGSVLVPGTRTFWAWPFERAHELGGQTPPSHPLPHLDFPDDIKARVPRPGENTTIGVVAVNARLSVAEARRVAMMAQDGYARAIRPIHTMGDGDVVFALASGTRELPEPRALYLSRLGAIAADTMARAVARGVFEAKSLGNLKGYRDSAGQGR